jgi:hypothetical protein
LRDNRAQDFLSLKQGQIAQVLAVEPEEIEGKIKAVDTFRIVRWKVVSLPKKLGAGKLRSDIPINLPSDYEKEALLLRNKLLMSRFRNLHTPRSLKDYVDTRRPASFKSARFNSCELSRLNDLETLEFLVNSNLPPLRGLPDGVQNGS